MLNRPKKKPLVIKLCRLFGLTISTRQAVLLLARKLPKSAVGVTLDFSNIEFVSRSFAHELLRFIESSANPIELTGLSEAVKCVFGLVKAHKRNGGSRYEAEEITDTSARLSDSSLQF